MTRRGEPKSHSFLLGIGLDNGDGHYRQTTGDDFKIVGGSEGTHRKLQDKVLEISDDLAKKGKSIKDIGPDDFDRITDIIRN
jgi:hypothetical protein